MAHRAREGWSDPSLLLQERGEPRLDRLDGCPRIDDAHAARLPRRDVEVGAAHATEETHGLRLEAVRAAPAVPVAPARPLERGGHRKVEEQRALRAQALLYPLLQYPDLAGIDPVAAALVGIGRV